MLQSEEPDALRDLETRYKWKVIRLAERFGVGNDADDVWQEVCLRIKELKDASALGSFIHKTAVHLCMDAKRKAYMRNVSLDDIQTAHMPTSQKNPEEQLLTQERQQLIERALKSLPAAEREVVELIDLQGLKPQEVSRELNKPPNTIHVFYYRARKKMRHFIEARGRKAD